MLLGASSFRASFRSTLSAQPPPVAVYVELADIGQFNNVEYENTLRRYLREKYQGKPVDVLVAHGSKMFEMALRLRNDLWPTVPLVFATVDQTATEPLNASQDVTGAFVGFSLHKGLMAARALVPDLKQIFHVGDPWELQPFFRHFSEELPDLAKEIEVINLAGLALPDVRKRVSNLPPNTAIIYTSMYTDGVGSSITPVAALASIAEMANRPIIAFAETHIGFGASGGFVARPRPVGEDAARRVLRILNGEAASSMPIVVGDFLKPIFDWRQLQRFGIDDSRLPPDSEIKFRTLTIWEQYRWYMVAVFSIVLVQSLMISGLFFERQRRHAAELLSRRRFLEVMHLNRIAAAGAISASIAHELNQPLGAILSNAEAAKALLARDRPDIDRIKDMVEDIHRDDQRAADIIRRLRGLLKRKDVVLQDFDLNEVIATTLSILEPEAAKREIKLGSFQTSEPLPVRADQVHLQQVLVNLAINGMDAIQSASNADRVLTFKTTKNDNANVEVAVSDSGDGIQVDKLKEVFETFYTTKPQGTGLGLSIARTIVETYGGKVWAENSPLGGATFRFTLPIVSARLV